MRNHLETHAAAPTTAGDSQSLAPVTPPRVARESEQIHTPIGILRRSYNSRRCELSARLFSREVSGAPFDNGQSFGDPFVSKDTPHMSRIQSPQAATLPPNHIRNQFQDATFRNFSRPQAGHDGVSRPGGAHIGSASSFLNPNLIPLDTNSSTGSGNFVPIRTPRRFIPPHVEDARPPSASVPHDHPLRIQVQNLRKLRRQRENEWEKYAHQHPQQWRNINHIERAAYEKEMKNMTSQEFDLLEFVERLEEGETIEDLNMDLDLRVKCLLYENQKGRSALDALHTYDHFAQDYGYAYPSYPPYNSQYPASRFGSSEMIIPSIERDDDEDDTNIKTEENLTQAAQDSVDTLPPPITFPELSHRPALGLSSLPLRNRSEFVLPARPVLNQQTDHEFLKINKLSSQIEIIDLTDEVHPAQPNKDQAQRVSTHNAQHPSTPRIRLTAAGLAQKRLRNASATPFGSSVEPKRRKLKRGDQKRDHEEPLMELQKFRTDPAVLDRYMPEDAVDSDEDYNEEENDGGNRIGSV